MTKSTSAIALIIKDGLILGVSRKDNHNIFGLPGGKFDPSKDVDTRETVIREVKEETNITIKECGFLWSRISNGGNCDVYYVMDFEGDPISMEEGIVQWLTVEEITKTKAAFQIFNTDTIKLFRTCFPNIYLR